jgi:hypothetical protein
MTLPISSDSTSTDESRALLIIERVDDPTASSSAKWFGAGSKQGPVYTIRRGGNMIWSVGIDFSDASHVPFREEVFWEAAGVVVIGGGAVVHFFDAQSGALRSKIDVPCYFGHLALARIPKTTVSAEELLLILGWTDVYAIDSRLETRWVARDIAVDGIVFGEVRESAVILSAEMDPPGGWVDVALDLVTGAEVGRGV